MFPEARAITFARRHRPDRLGRRAAALAAVAGSVALGVITVAVPSASAGTPAQPHDPIGSTRSIVAVPVDRSAGPSILAKGWAGDPDALTRNVRVYAVQDGNRVVASTRTNVAMPSVSRIKGLGATPGFALTIPVSTGTHTICVMVHSLDRGVDKVLRCVATPLGTKLSSSTVALHSPQGAVTSAAAGSSSVSFQGWTTDADDLARRSTVVLYLDGTPASTVITHAFTAPTTPPTGAGARSAFTISVPAASGTHEGCIWAVNVGFGSNTMLGCQAVDTRAGTSVTGGAPASIGAKVVKEAKKHIGQPYVWGSTGPKTFDCSGLVMYSYSKFGYTTPRVSADQFRAARLIPASSAVPGDLVFYHDDEGQVYHVGIYLSPLQTVAAIDPAEGVDYQSIWDPSTATYGSFTHD
jgi:cell wall-associated NlpC family hydrolase